MISAAWTLAKLSLFAVVVLILGQIEIGSKTISLHVHSAINPSSLKSFSNWIAGKVDFASNGMMKSNQGRAPAVVAPPIHSQHFKSMHDESEEDQKRLSGFLKNTLKR